MEVGQFGIQSAKSSWWTQRDRRAQSVRHGEKDFNLMLLMIIYWFKVRLTWEKLTAACRAEQL